MEAVEQSGGSPFSPVARGCAIVSMALVLSCCLIPPIVNRLLYGRWGTSRDFSHVKPGMTPEQMIDLVGPPHERIDRSDYKSWTYREGFLGLPTYGITFTEDGVVKDWYVH